MPSASRLGKMGNVDEKPRVDVQANSYAILGDGRYITQRLVLTLPPRPETDLVRVGRDDIARRPQVNVARFGVDDHWIASGNPFDDTPRLSNSRQPKGPRDDGHVALATTFLDNEAAQLRAVVVQKLGRPHGTCDQNCIVGQLKPFPRGCCATGQDAQQPVRKIVKITQPLPPVGIVLPQHPGTRGVLHPLDRRFRGKPLPHSRLEPTHPAAVVGEHAVGFEHLPMVAGLCQGLDPHHLVEARAQLVHGRLEPLQLDVNVLGEQLGDDDPRLVQHDVPERNALRNWLAVHDACERTAELCRSPSACHCSGHDVLRYDHSGREQHLDVLIGVLAPGSVLDGKHPEHRPAPQDRDREH